jgi:hypothetical protein
MLVSRTVDLRSDVQCDAMHFYTRHTTLSRQTKDKAHTPYFPSVSKPLDFRMLLEFQNYVIGVYSAVSIDMKKGPKYKSKRKNA